ncbi:MAG: PilC/PilY family type IV pilus protein [Gammaproteobacteria bacterium]
MSNLIKRYLSNAGITAAAATWVLFTGMPVLADDTEIYFGQPEANPDNNPNILLIIDSSGSMDETVWDDVPLYRDRLEVVQDVTNSLIDELEDVNIGMMKFDIRYTQRPGWENDYDLLGQGGMVVHPISDLATNKSDLIQRINDIHHFGSTPLAETYYEAGLYYLGEKVDFGFDSWHGFQLEGDENTTYIGQLYSHPDSYTGSKYDSPFRGTCQRNYIVYLSDGAPTYDDSAEDRMEDLMGDPDYTEHSETECLNADNGSSSGRCIDEFAEFLYANDFNSTLDGKQNVVSHFIGFNVDLPIFAEAARRGGGNYYQANNADQLREDLTDILKEVADSSDGFTAPAITVNAFDRTSHLDQLFFTVFKPTATSRWGGNLKKYKFEPRDSGDGLVIVDANGDPAVDPDTGFFYDGRDPNGQVNAALPKAQSYWSVDEDGNPIADGADVAVGGASSVLPVDPQQRNIYTNSGTSVVTLESSTAFSTKLDALHALGQGYELTSAEWRNWALGYDVKDEDEDGSMTDARKDLGAPLHSKPTVVVYGGTTESPDAVIFMGTNDGLLHAISSQTGEELWAFMPEELHGIVPELAENAKSNGEIPYGIDGHIVVEKNDDGDGTITSTSPGDKVYLYFGMRRGGDVFYKLDVTDYTAKPKVEWIFDKATGQSWSRPVIAKVNFGTDANPIAKKVVLIGGGYDPAQESQDSYTADVNVKGNAIHMIDADSGAELWRAAPITNAPVTGAFLEVPEMKSPIPSSVRVLDMDIDGFVDRMYVNDLNGRLFRFDIHTDGTSQRVTAGVIAELGGTDMSGVENNRRYYYAPDVALSSTSGTQFLTITMGSGFRANPLNQRTKDRLSGVRDYNVFNKLGIDSSSDGSEYNYDATFDTLSLIVGNNENQSVPVGAKGWYLTLGNDGRKALARSRIFQNKAFFTTYTPGEASASNPCAPAVGTGRLYTIDLRTGATVVNNLEKPGIPPEITFIFGEPDEGDTDDCFGAGCVTTGGGDQTGQEPDLGGPDGTDDENSTKPGERQVECLAGPESCDADAAEVPRRTFWRQTTED